MAGAQYLTFARTGRDAQFALHVLPFAPLLVQPAEPRGAADVQVGLLVQFAAQPLLESVAARRRPALPAGAVIRDGVAGHVSASCVSISHASAATAGDGCHSPPK